MRSIDAGGPAFPVHPDMAERIGCINSVSDTGMSLRDYFAAKAMQGMLACPGEDDFGTSCVAINAYLIADAKRRYKRQQKASRRDAIRSTMIRFYLDVAAQQA